jgi:hypothetical protein
MQGFDDQKLKNLQLEKKIKLILDQRLQFNYPSASIKDVQVTKEPSALK